MIPRIEAPRTEDAEQLGRVLLAAWLQTYPHAESGIDENWIREQRGSSASAEGSARWREFIEEAAQRPDLLFCRVVRSGSAIAGFLCGRREGDAVTLGPMYLLDEVRGEGFGRRMMGEFLDWAGSAPMRLWVTEYNVRAIRFYERYGFAVTAEREMWRGRLPNVRMVRGSAPNP